MTNAAAKTGAGPMLMAAVEHHFPEGQRIIDDALAGPILPFAMRAFVWLVRPGWARDWLVRKSEKTVPGIWAGVGCRKRYIDEKIAQSLSQIDVVVNLGAGFDTRAFQLPALANIPLWEVDQPVNIQAKQVRLCKLLGKLPAHVTLVPVDFDHQELGAVLDSHGYSLAKRTFFIWEAVTQYLTEAGVRQVFDYLARSASGSRLCFTYIRKDFIAGQTMYAQEVTYRKYILRDKSWLFGMQPEGVSDFLAGYGWRLVEHLGYEELAERYVKPTGRQLASTPIERMVNAEKV